MKFIKQNDGSMNILVDNPDDYELTDYGVDVILSKEQLEDLIIQSGIFP
jgi:hypothetical protein